MIVKGMVMDLVWLDKYLLCRSFRAVKFNSIILERIYIGRKIRYFGKIVVLPVHAVEIG